MGTATAAERYQVTPDMITFAKGVTNGVIPMGGVIASKTIYDAFAPEERLASRTLSRLHLFRTSCCGGGRVGDLKCLPRRKTLRARQADREMAGGCGAQTEGRALRRRHPQFGRGSRHRHRTRAGRARQARPRSHPPRLLRRKYCAARGRRHDCFRPRSHSRTEPHRTAGERRRTRARAA